MSSSAVWEGPGWYLVQENIVQSEVYYLETFPSASQGWCLLQKIQPPKFDLFSGVIHNGAIRIVASRRYASQWIYTLTGGTTLPEDSLSTLQEEILRVIQASESSK